MKSRLFLLTSSLILFLILIVPQISVRGEPNVFVIENADATNTLSFTYSPDLLTLISNVSKRFIIDHANASNTLFFSTPPADFLAALGVVEDRFVIDHANESNTISLYYPRDLIGDTRAPVVVSVDSSPQSGNIVLTIVTNEFTTAEIDYGSAHGVYPNTLVDGLFGTTHTFTLPGLNSGERYYYRLTLTDRSGIVTHTAEAILEPIQSIYLPALIHR